ncbi:hypothetical protein C0991_007775 [Blastosporella zonata]|nr:hypothetical protein C0991_007775 [Blastosporella zonata]
MLTLVSGCNCDICLEPFATGPKSASAIFCGHVFCSDCINHLRAAPPTVNHPDPNYKPCPLCRQTFDTRQHIRLHVHHDSASPQASSTTTWSSASELEAHSLLEKIVAIADNGCSEEDSRKCTDDVTKFLHAQRGQGNKFLALGTSCRLLGFIIKAMASQRDDQALIAELGISLTQIHEELATVERKAKLDKEKALSNENTLYNELAVECSVIRQQVQSQREEDSRDRPSVSDRLSPEELGARIERRIEVDQSQLMPNGHTVDADDFMISPLAMFSSLPAQPFALPDEEPTTFIPTTYNEPPPRHGFRNHVLENLLQDSSAASPIGAPSSSAHSSSQRDSSRSEKRDASGLGSYILPQTSSEASRLQHQQELPSPAHGFNSKASFVPPVESSANRSVHVPMPSMTQMSSASSAAKARERERGERAERERWEEKERRRVMRAEEDYTPTENYAVGNSNMAKTRRAPEHSRYASSSSRQSSARDPLPDTSASQRAYGSSSKSNRYAERYGTDGHDHQHMATQQHIYTAA